MRIHRTRPAAFGLRRFYRRMRAAGQDWRWLWRQMLPLAAVGCVLLASPAQAACEIRAAADCHGSNLAGIDLRGRNLRGIDFTGADLSEADMRGADLAGALLVGTRARNAQFDGAWLGESILDGADFAGASLRRKDTIRARSMAGARMPDGSVCPIPSNGACAGAPASAWRPRKPVRRAGFQRS